MSKDGHAFKVLPLYFSSESSSHHELFIKDHSIRTYDESKPPGKTLFVINVPPYVDEESLKNAFSPAGKIKSIVYQDSFQESASDKSENGFKVAYVVFEKREGLLGALNLDNLNPLSSKKRPLLIGLNKWIRDYNMTVYNHECLNKEVNKYIRESDKREAAKDQHQEVDEGWTLVTKKGRKPGMLRKESVENKIIQKNKIKSRRKELKNFYTFQIKEQKMKNIIALRKNFQESKEKVNLMKKMRKFKPF